MPLFTLRPYGTIFFVGIFLSTNILSLTGHPVIPSLRCAPFRLVFMCLSRFDRLLTLAALVLPLATCASLIRLLRYRRGSGFPLTLCASLISSIKKIRQVIRSQAQIKPFTELRAVVFRVLSGNGKRVQASHVIRTGIKVICANHRCQRRDFVELL